MSVLPSAPHVGRCAITTDGCSRVHLFRLFHHGRGHSASALEACPSRSSRWRQQPIGDNKKPPIRRCTMDLCTRIERAGAGLTSNCKLTAAASLSARCTGLPTCGSIDPPPLVQSRSSLVAAGFTRQAKQHAERPSAFLPIVYLAECQAYAGHWAGGFACRRISPFGTGPCTEEPHWEAAY